MLLHNPCCCTTVTEDPNCVDTCEGCPIPKRNLPISMVGFGRNADRSGQLVYKGSLVWSWLYKDIDGSVFTNDLGDPVATAYKEWRIDCSGGDLVFSFTLWDITRTQFQSIFSDNVGGCMRIDSQTCNPFKMHLTLSQPSSLICYSNSDVNRIVSVDIDGTGLTGGGCCQTFTVTGCNSLPIYLATVNVRASSGGTILATGTTDFDGQVGLAWDGGCTQYVEVVYSPEFNTVGSSLAMTAGGTTTLARSSNVATGYHCMTSCPVPAPDTMHATHPVFGSLTYTYSGGNWVSSFNYSYPGFGSCTAKTVAVTCTWNGGSSYTEVWKSNVNCPDNAGATTTTATWSLGSFSCPPSWSRSFTRTPSAGAQQNMYQTSSPLAVTLTP